MNKQVNMEERLWDYLDGVSSPEEKTVIEQLLQSHAEWKTKYHELLEVQQLLHTSELETPSLRFSKNVMEEISKLYVAPAAKNYINKRVIRGIAIFFITLITGFLIYGFAQTDWTATSGDHTISDKINKVDFTKIDFSKFFSNTWVNVFMMVNVILGLFLLDNYFSNKRKEFRKEM